MTEETIFAVALTKPPPHRGGYLDDACAGDASLRERVQSLIIAHEAAGNFLHVPAIEQAAGVITERAGHTIGRYKLLEQIGEGGMGVVYMAEQEHPVRRRVALKIIKPGMDSRQVIARFESERQALAMMDHPNIARVLDAGTTDTGRPYFVMELVMGVPITRFCDENELSTRQRLELLIPVCHAVQHAHQKGIIHRDLKPGNVMVVMFDGVPVPKVIDFGVAKATSSPLTERTLFTGFGQIVGTLEYMSPEQAEMSGIDVDTRSDIYALGVLMYELLTGTTPLERDRVKQSSFNDLVRRIREEEPDRPSMRLSRSREALGKVSAQRKMEPAHLSRSLRGELDWIVLKALEKDRARRYQTANALARDIQRYLADETVEACPPSRSYRVRKFARKHRGLLAGALAFAMLLVCGAVISTWLAIRAIDAERDQAKLRDKAEKKELEARTAATRSEQVAQILTRMLHAAGPHTAQGKDTTLLRQMLDQTAQQLDAELKDHPEVEADLRYTIAFTYWDLGDENKCEVNLRRAMEKYRAALGPEHAKTALAMGNLGACMTRRGRQSEGGPMAAKGLEIARRAGNVEALAECLHARAASLGRDMLVIEAEPYLREAIAIREKLGHRVSLARDKAALATCLSAHGRYTDAEPIRREVLAFEREQFGPEHPRTIMSVHALAYCLGCQEKLTEAKALAAEAFERSRKINPVDHPTVAMTMRNRLDVLIRLKEWEAGRAMLDQLIAESSKNADFRVARGNLFARRGEWSGAIDDLSAAALINPENDSVAMHLGLALLYSGRDQKSRDHMKAALARFNDTKETSVADKIAKLALLHKPSGAELEAACRLADLGAQTTGPSWLMPWTQLCGALAACRRERWEVAVDLAQKSHSHPSAAAHARAAAQFIEAMALARLGKKPAAEEAWKRGETLLERGRIREAGDFGKEWPDWLVADLLGREAAALLKGGSNGP